VFYPFVGPKGRARVGGWRVVPAEKGPPGGGGGPASVAGPGAALVVAPPRSVAAVAICDGEIDRVVPPRLTLSPWRRSAGSTLWLVPSPAARDRLARLLLPELEVPVAFAYIGLDSPPDGEGPGPTIPRRVRAGERLGVFGASAPLPGLRALVGPRAWLDVIALYARLLNRGAVAEKAAIADMLGRAGRRALVSLRDEWNQPLSAGEVWLEDGTGRERRVPLAETWGSTLALPGHWRRHLIRVRRRTTAFPAAGIGSAVPITRPPGEDALLTPASGGEAALPELRLELRPPAHRALQALWPDDWLAAQEPGVPEHFRPRRWTEGNLVHPLVDGAAFFADLCRQVDEGRSGEGGLFLTANWWIDTSLELVPGRTLQSLLEQLAAGGTRICLLVWDNALLVETLAHLATALDSRLLPGLRGLGRLVSTALLKNRQAVGGVRALPGGEALADPYVSGLAGTHHQKLAILARPDRTIAWCGGIDFNWNRLDGPGHAGRHPYHDVHCRVEGPAADELYRTFRDRWNHHPSRPADPLPTAPPAGEAPARGSCLVQVARTYPQRVDYPRSEVARPYAPRGDFTAARTLIGAMRRARRYVYIEDQCLSVPEVAAALAEAVARPEFACVIAVLPKLDSPENFFWVARQAGFLRRVGREAPGKVRAYWVHQSPSEGGRPIYVHSKVVIVDDVFASIGSVNLNRRGLYNDSEVGVCIVDGATRQGGRRFAVDLRRRLWAEHLGLSPSDPRLDDPVVAAALFETPPPAGRVRPWQPGAAGRVRLPDWLWHKLVDPGSP